MRIREFFIVGFPTFILSLTATANTVADARVDSVVVRHHKLEETIVTANAPERKITSATPVFGVDQQAVNSTGITDIADALHRLPGVNLRDYGGAGGLKTVSVRGLGASHTAVLYDGLPLSDSQSGAIDLSRFSTDNTRDLTLIIGDNNDLLVPARLTASPATVSLTSPFALTDKSTDLTLKLRVGSFGMYSPYVNLTQSIGNSLKLNIAGEFLHARNDYPFKWQNGQLTTVERRENNLVNSGHAETNVFWTDSCGNSLIAKAYYYDNSRQLPGPVLFYNVNGSREYLRERNAFAQAAYTRRFNSRWTLRVAGKFNWAASLYTDDGATQPGVFRQDDYFQREWYATANLLFQPDSHWSLSYAADYFRNSLNSNREKDSQPYRNSLLQALSVNWRCDRFTLLARLIGSVYLNGALNPETRSPRNHRRLSPSVTASLRLLNNELLFLRAGYKNIFRMPTFNEAFFNHFGSPDLQPENTDQLNVGLTFQLSRREFLSELTLTADGYYNRVSDKIVAVPYNMFVWTVTNVGSVRMLGADVTLAGTLSASRGHDITFSGNWSYQRASIEAEPGNISYHKQVAYTPLNSGAFSVGWENPWVNLVWHGQGTSARYSTNANTPESRVAGYFEFGATAWRTFQVKSCRMELRLDIKNILDKQYYIIARYPMPGRSWQVSVKFNI